MCLRNGEMVGLDRSAWVLGIEPTPMCVQYEGTEKIRGFHRIEISKVSYLVDAITGSLYKPVVINCISNSRLTIDILPAIAVISKCEKLDAALERKFQRWRLARDSKTIDAHEEIEESEPA